MKYTVNIRDFGASEGIMNTEAIQAAVDDCFLKGGGVVVVPAGTYKTGSIRLRSNITLYLEKGAILLGSRDPMDYFGYRQDKLEPLPADEITDMPLAPFTNDRCETAFDPDTHRHDHIRKPGSRWNSGLIRAIHAENVSIIGEEGSLIDGADCYDELGEEQYRGPHAVHFFDCKNIRLSGYTVKNSSNWAHNLIFSSNIICENVQVYAGHDGIHMTTCSNITISNCLFMTGDDCIAGFGNVNVTVTGCEINSACSAMRFGGTNAVIRNCHIYGPGKYVFRGSLTKEEKIAGKTALASEVKSGRHRFNMLSVFTYYADYTMPIPEEPGNILIEDCVVENADRFLHYNYSGNETWQKHKPLSSVTFRNIKTAGLRMPLTAYGNEEHKITLSLENIEIGNSPEYAYPALIHACHVKQLTMENVTIADTPIEMLVKTWSDGGRYVFENVSCDIPEEKRIVRTDEEFICRPI